MIVDCLIHAQDTHVIAEKLREISEGRIKTGVYNAAVADGPKQQLHIAWREGVIKVVCATIGESFALQRDFFMESVALDA